MSDNPIPIDPPDTADMRPYPGVVLPYPAPLPTPLQGTRVEMLEHVVAGVKDGSIGAFAVVARENGYSRCSTWYAPSLADRYNLVGQLTALQSDIIADINRITGGKA